MKTHLNRLTALLCFSVATAGFSQTNGTGNLTVQAVAQKSVDAYDALASYSDTGKTVEFEAGRTNITMFSIRMQRTNLFKVHWVRTGENQTNTGTWWADGHPPFSPHDSYLLTNYVGQQLNSHPTIISIPFARSIINDTSGEVTLVPQLFLNMDPYSGNILTSVASAQWNSGNCKTELAEGKIGAVDCFLITVTQEVNDSNNRKWKTVRQLGIGKQDYLLRQFQFKSDYHDRFITQAHENILVNQRYSAADFQEKIPTTNSSITLHSAPRATSGSPKKLPFRWISRRLTRR